MYNAIECEWLFKLGHSRSYDFDTNRKRACDFLLLNNSNVSPCTVSEIRRLKGQKSQLFQPPVIYMPSFRMNPVEFLDKSYIAKNRVLALSVAEDFVDSILRRFDTTSARDEQRDGLTD